MSVGRRMLQTEMERMLGILFLLIGFIAVSHGQSFNQATGALISCVFNPCLNGGICASAENGTKSCKCPENHVGQFCQHISPCYTGTTTRRCFNRGECVVDFKGLSSISSQEKPDFHCNCRVGYSAYLCEIPLPNVCDSNPCQNGGSCNLLSLTNHTCSCRRGYRGPLCDQVDFCTTQPCKHAGTCQSTDTGYQCLCKKGYKGDTCLEDIDECAISNPCKNGAPCINKLGYYKCQCPKGYTGVNCDEIYVPCSPNPCLNGGSCSVDPRDRYKQTCSCPAGYQGKLCEHNIDECVNNLCQNGAKCTDGLNSYTCECRRGFTGIYCQKDINECEDNPSRCQNGATCQNTRGDYECICVNGWRGKNCEFNVDDCSAHVCFNGGTCIDRVGSFACVCPPGKTGLLCHLNDSCFANPCHGAATCESNPIDGTYSCLCPRGFEGENCDQDVDECSIHVSRPVCAHKGKCRNTPGSFACDCAKGYTGTRCEQNVNECASNPCQNDGTCLDKVGEYKCACMPEFGGENCEIDIDECRSKPCLNKGVCRNMSPGFSCTCPIGFEGTKCEIAKNRCDDGGRCENGATCHPTGDIRCQCPPGFTGYYCQDSVNNCASSPCVRGTCIDLVNNFTCDCVPGFTGRHCDYRVNECASQPCQNGGQCENAVGTYYCKCPPGFFGVQCEQRRVRSQDVSWETCYTGYCKNDGACVETEQGLQCRCRPGFSGERCQQMEDVCRTNPCSNGGKCQPDYRPGLFKCDCPPEYTGSICEIAKSAPVQQTVIEPPKFICPLAGCSAKAKNGKCDEECNTIECDYDGQECSLHVNPWLNCTMKTRAPCWNFFRNGRCDPECNIAECMFDGFDCGIPLGYCDPYCTKLYGNGHCDEQCNRAECDFDGLDCDKDEAKLVDGTLVVIVRVSPETFRTGSAAFLQKLGRVLRSVATIKKDDHGKDEIMPWTLNGGIALDPQDNSASASGTAVSIQLDNRKCLENCIPTADAAASFLAAAQQRGELDLGYPLYSVQAQADRVVADSSPSSNNLYWLLLIGLLVLCMVTYGVVTWNQNRKRIKSTTWFPDGFVNVTSTAALNEHLTLTKRDSDMKKSPSGYDNHSDASTISYCDSDAERQTKRMRREEPSKRQWNQSHFEVADARGGRGDMYALTPPSQHHDGPNMDINAKGPGGMTPLMLAAVRGNGLAAEPEERTEEDNAVVQIVHDLLLQGADIDEQSEEHGETALHMAARCQRADVARILLDNGADVNARDANGRTPLHTTVAADAIEVFHLLKHQRKIDWTARTADGTTPLILAIRLNINDMVDELLKVDQLDINAADEQKRTPLHWAAAVNNAQGCKQLLYKGAKVDVQDEAAQTPLFLAAKEGNFEAARELLDHKASPELADDMDRLPRDVAAEKMHMAVVRLLDEHKEIIHSPPQNMHNKNFMYPSHTVNLATLSRFTNKAGRNGKTYGPTFLPDPSKKHKRTPLDMATYSTMQLQHQPPTYADAAQYAPAGFMNWSGASDLKHGYYDQQGKYNNLQGQGQQQTTYGGGFGKYPTPPSVHSSNATPSPAMGVHNNDGYVTSSPDSPGNWSSSPSGSSEWSDGVRSPQGYLAGMSLPKQVNNNMYHYITANNLQQDPQHHPMYL